MEVCKTRILSKFNSINCASMETMFDPACELTIWCVMSRWMPETHKRQMSCTFVSHPIICCFVFLYIFAFLYSEKRFLTYFDNREKPTKKFKNRQKTDKKTDKKPRKPTNVGFQNYWISKTDKCRFKIFRVGGHPRSRLKYWNFYNCNLKIYSVFLFIFHFFTNYEKKVCQNVTGLIRFV